MEREAAIAGGLQAKQQSVYDCLLEEWRSADGWQAEPLVIQLG